MVVHQQSKCSAKILAENSRGHRTRAPLMTGRTLEPSVGTTGSGRLPLEWGEHGLVVLGGAGLSVGSPANVPSWWDFNQAVLDGLRHCFAHSIEAPVHARRALERLSLNDLEVTEFSQVVHNAFAGLTWFDLLGVLDGEEPNTTHCTLSTLARSGILQTIVTTNFDTLLERALPSNFRTFNALIDEPPPERSVGALVKLHGTGGEPRSLVDLAAQKRRGLPPAWRSWLEALFSNRCVLVLGFSGADLDLADDYLGLQAAASSTPWLAWNLRRGVPPHPRAAAVVRAAADHGEFLIGDLPEVLEGLGISLTRVKSRGGSEEDRLAEAVRRWLTQDGVDSAVCGVALARLLDAAGSHTAADALRSRLRTQARRALRKGVNLSSATRVSLVLGQIGIDDRQVARSLKDLDLSERALTAVVENLRQSRDGLSSEGEIEYARNMSASIHSRAVWLIRQGDVDGAEREVERAWEYIMAMPETEQLDRLAAHWQNTGAIAWLRGDKEGARRSFEKARQVAEKVGDLAFVRSAEDNLGRLQQTVEKQ